MCGVEEGELGSVRRSFSFLDLLAVDFITSIAFSKLG